jgi:hypothetical protein
MIRRTIAISAAFMDASVATAAPLPLSSFLKRKSAFWTAMLIGAPLRIYCFVFTNDTRAMDDWEDHAQPVLDRGHIRRCCRPRAGDTISNK